MKPTTMLISGALCTIVSATLAQAALEDNPYSKIIVGANVFKLTSPPADTPKPPPPEPVPSITLQGITSICGRPQVLLKVVTPAKAGATALETSFLLDEGQSRNEIEVLEIDLEREKVRFKNHGETQTLSLR
jgi:hypothetical protein